MDETTPQSVADLVEQLVERALATPAIGRGEPGADAALASHLEACAKRIRATWAADFDPGRALATLAHPRLRREARAEARPLPGDGQRVWAPASHAAIVAVAAASVDEPGFEAAVSEARRATTAARIARDSVDVIEDTRPTIARWANDDPEGQIRVDAARAVADAREATARGAIEAAWALLFDALSAYPPLGVALAADAAATMLRGELQTAEWYVDPRTGAPCVGVFGAARALVLHALGRLSARVAAAFPGVSVVRGPRGRGAASPYRAHRPADEEAPLERTSTRLAAALTSASLERARDDAARLAGGLWLLRASAEREGGAPGLLEGHVDVGGVWDASLDARMAWYVRVLRAQSSEVVAALALAAPEAWPYRIERATFHVHEALAALALAPYRGGRGVVHGQPIVNLDAAFSRLDRLREIASAVFGLRLDRASLTLAVAHLLDGTIPVSRPNVVEGEFLPEPEVVRLLAEVLRPTRFSTLHRRVAEAKREAAACKRELAAAIGRVSLLDRINVLTDSDAERERDTLRERVRSLEADAERAVDRSREELEAALATYPPVDVWIRLEAVTEALRGVHHRYELGEHVLVGQDEAILALRRWAKRALGMATVPPAGTLLEAHAAARLGRG